MLNKKKILICEDEGIVAKDIHNRLKKMGYDICAVVASGEEAIKKTGETVPDLVLMDIRLKGELDGIEAARKIYIDLEIPVIYLTANADASTWNRTHTTQPFGYIIKPFKEKQLQASIEIALAKYDLEQQLKEREKWLSAVLNSIGDAVITSDEVGLITYMNPVAEAMTGWMHQDILGKDSKTIFTLIDSDTGTPIETPISHILQSNTLVNIRSECILIDRTVRQIPISYCTTLLIDDQDNITGVVWVFQDMTLAKQLALSELKSNFIAMTNHEFRTPLTTIISSAELLERYHYNWNSEKQLKHLHRIQTAVNHMSEMLDKVLIFSKVEAGKLECNLAPLDLVAWCRELVDDFQIGGDKQYLLVFSDQVDSTLTAQGLPLDSHPTYLDEKLLRHIFTNLLSNAIKYSPEGNTVRFSLVRQEGQAIFKIQDSGIGIRPEDQKRLFDSFYRASNVGNTPGTGLGLAIVKNCVELHRGHISVESDVDVGTTFTVTLPTNSSL